MDRYWPQNRLLDSRVEAKLLIIGGHSRIRTYDFHRVKVALYR